MRTLELKIPPPAVAVLIAGAMWGISLHTPAFAMPAPIRVAVAAIIALAGFGTVLAGVFSFRRANTTIHPMNPELTTALVRSGIYAVSRNPMYVGLCLILVAWAVFLSSAWALLGPPAFVLYMNRFQIAPEERVLSAKFGAAYAAYKASVPRWL